MSTDNLYEPETPKSEDVNLTIRVPSDLRDKFSHMCTVRQTNVSRVIRKFIENELKKAST